MEKITSEHICELLNRLNRVEGIAQSISDLQSDSRKNPVIMFTVQPSNNESYENIEQTLYENGFDSKLSTEVNFKGTPQETTIIKTMMDLYPSTDKNYTRTTEITLKVPKPVSDQRVSLEADPNNPKVGKVVYHNQ